MLSSFDPSLKYIVLWILLSSILIMFNKAILVDCDFPFPMFLTTMHMTFATVMTQVLSRTTDLLPGVKEKKVDSEALYKKIFPIALFFAFSLVFSNYAYVYLSVAYIQMLKAFMIVAVLLLSAALGLQQASCIELNIIVIISSGIALTTIGESEFSWVGFTFQALAIFFEAFRLVMVNIILKDLKLDSLSTLYYNAPFCAVLIGISCGWFELSRITADKFTLPFCALLVLNGFMAFSLNIASLMLIKNTSALILSLAGVFKDIFLVLSSVLVFQTPVSLLQYIGYSISLLAMNLHKEYQKNKSLGGPTSSPTTTSSNSPTVSRNNSNSNSDLQEQEKGSLLPK